jgi:hypothetical protein
MATEGQKPAKLAGNCLDKLFDLPFKPENDAAFIKIVATRLKQLGEDGMLWLTFEREHELSDDDEVQYCTIRIYPDNLDELPKKLAALYTLDYYELKHHDS